MSSGSPLSRPLARELLTREMQDHRLVPAAEAVFSRLHESLSRSIGQAGYGALLTRAMSQARERHPGLDLVAFGSAPGPWLPGLDKSVKDFGDAAASEAVVDLLVELIELLSRFVGRTLAERLIQRAWPEHVQEGNPSGNSQEQNG
jgi:hypothetical protein